MAGLYNRVTGRGFPSRAVAGMTGEGALESQGDTVDPSHSQTATGLLQPPSQLPGMPLGTPGDVYTEVLPDIEGSGWLEAPDGAPGYGPGTMRTHAAPAPGWAGSYQDHEAIQVLHRNSEEIHAQDFGTPKIQDFRGNSSPGFPDLRMDPWSANQPELTGPPTQVPLEGAQRVLGGIDAVQGYDRRNRYGFDAGHRHRNGITSNVIVAFLEPAERQFVVPQGSGTYNPSDEVQGPDGWYGFNSAENVHYNPPSGYAAPPEPDTLSQPLTEATAWGW